MSHDDALRADSALHAARTVLRETFGHAQFRPGQEEAIARIMAGEDLTLVMPTGSGKSACFQVPALLLDGLTLVVSPLIALMKDQVEALQAKGVAASYVNSTLDQDAQRSRLADAAAGRTRLLYVAPERLAAPAFLRTLESRPPALVAIDEAHCISQWGHDFRPAYLGIQEFLARLPRRPQVLALTGTATARVRQDVAEQLGIPPERLLMTGFRRENLRLVARRCDRKADRIDQILGIAGAVKGSGIVYCATRRDVEDVAEALADAGHDAAGYHAGMPDETRTDVQERFVSSRVRIIVATNAFGMGIDKADVRFVVHHSMPGSLEAYWQEAGRAGRDGRPSWCVLLFGAEDKFLHEFFLNGSHPTPEQVLSCWQRLVAEGADVVERPVTHLASGTGLSDMVFSGALRLLETAGLVDREAASREGDDRRTRRILVPQRGLPMAGVRKKLEQPLARSAERRARGEERVRAMERYAWTSSCRHQALLRYFGDDLREPCAACDACCGWDRKAAQAAQASLASPARRGLRRPSRIARLSEEDQSQARHAAIAALAEIHQRFGVTMARLVLRGSRSKKVTGARLDQSPSFGALARLSEKDVTALLDDLEREGLFESSGGMRPVVVLTEEGRIAAGR